MRLIVKLLAVLLLCSCQAAEQRSVDEVAGRGARLLPDAPIPHRKHLLLDVGSADAIAIFDLVVEEYLFGVTELDGRKISKAQLCALPDHVLGRAVLVTDLVLEDDAADKSLADLLNALSEGCSDRNISYTTLAFVNRYQSGLADFSELYPLAIDHLLTSIAPDRYSPSKAGSSFGSIFCLSREVEEPYDLYCKLWDRHIYGRND